MARSGINIRVKLGERFASFDVIYDLSDIEFRNWVKSKLDYEFDSNALSFAERYRVIEDMQDMGIQLYVDRDVLTCEPWWDNSLERSL